VDACAFEGRLGLDEPLDRSKGHVGLQCWGSQAAMRHHEGGFVPRAPRGTGRRSRGRVCRVYGVEPNRPACGPLRGGADRGPASHDDCI
jgi:hypothetical protein